MHIYYTTILYNTNIHRDKIIGNIPYYIPTILNYFTISYIIMFTLRNAYGRLNIVYTPIIYMIFIVIIQREIKSCCYYFF